MDALSHAVGKTAGREMGSSIPQMGPSAVTIGEGFAYTGRAVIDTANSRLVLMDVKSRLPSGEALPAEVPADKVRYYTIAGDTLTLTVKDAAGATTARTTWRKVH
jgi:hypothetical protein